jgi:hypothetical protein
MRFHDFNLSGYSVSKFGSEIVLDLVSDESHETSKVRFSGVAAYHFVHAGSAIIMDITQVPVPQLLKTTGDELAEWERTLGGLPIGTTTAPSTLRRFKRMAIRRGPSVRLSALKVLSSRMMLERNNVRPN